MGVDTRLFISTDFEVRDVKDVIQKRFDTKVKLDFSESSPDYVRLHFTVEGVERMLHCHTSSGIGGIKAMQLGLRANEQGVRILKVLAETFGGVLNEADCDNELAAYERPGMGNNLFLVNQAIKDNPSLGDDTDALIEYLKRHK